MIDSIEYEGKTVSGFLLGVSIVLISFSVLLLPDETLQLDDVLGIIVGEGFIFLATVLAVPIVLLEILTHRIKVTEQGINESHQFFIGRTSDDIMCPFSEIKKIKTALGGFLIRFEYRELNYDWKTIFDWMFIFHPWKFKEAIKKYAPGKLEVKS